GVLPVAIAARLPVAFEDVARVAREGTEELCRGGAGRQYEPDRKDTHTAPAPAGKPQTHDAPFLEEPSSIGRIHQVGQSPPTTMVGGPSSEAQLPDVIPACSCANARRGGPR